MFTRVELILSSSTLDILDRVKWVLALVIDLQRGNLWVTEKFKTGSLSSLEIKINTTN